MIRHQRKNAQFYKAMIRAEITVQENERKRIAYDLHDELGPLLSAVRLKINHLELANEEGLEILNASNKNIDDIVKKIRDISYNLLPNTLVRSGVIAAIKEYINKLDELNGLSIVFDAKDEKLNLSKGSEVSIYRIVQEVIHNTIKHSKASNLVIQLNTKGNKIYLATSDDGVGFDFSNGNLNGGLGLYNLQSRAEMLNAKFSVESVTGKGTQYLFEIPVK